MPQRKEFGMNHMSHERHLISKCTASKLILLDLCVGNVCTCYANINSPLRKAAG